MVSKNRVIMKDKEYKWQKPEGDFSEPLQMAESMKSVLENIKTQLMTKKIALQRQKQRQENNGK